MRKFMEWGTRLGPYLILEAVMPGGSVMAIVLFLHRRRQAAHAGKCVSS